MNGRGMREYSDGLGDRLAAIHAVHNPLKPQHDYIRELEAERDALRDENAELERQCAGWVKSATEAKDAERALRAQLDGMTTEWDRVSAAVHEDLADRVQVIVDRTQAPIQEIPGWLRSRAAEIRQRVEVE